MRAFQLSFEFFPPKTPLGQEHLVECATKLNQFNPHFFSVTYGAGGSTREGTIETLKLLQKNKLNVAPHLSCIGSSRTELIEIVKIYEELNVRRIVALRGDLPSGMGQPGELQNANELVELIREIMGSAIHIEVAAYPEYHPQADSVSADLFYFKKKIEAGANSAITQYFFNPDAYLYFRDQCQKLNIHVPIIPGIMPITCYHKLTRFSNLCGAEIPRWILKQLEEYKDNPQAIKSFGIEVVYTLCERLLKEGAPGLHFYTLNQLEPTIEIVSRCLMTV